MNDKLTKSEARRLEIQLQDKAEEEKSEVIEKYIEAKLGGEMVPKLQNILENDTAILERLTEKKSYLEEVKEYFETAIEDETLN